MRVLVTGGAGFIGSHHVPALLERGDEVVVPFEEGIERSVGWYGSNLAQPAA